jgi:predicted SAM-dependent methyltransferase
MRLNLGSNTVCMQGFENVDIRPTTGVTIVDDVATLEKIEDGSVEFIVANAILEHFSPDRIDDILKVWYRKLQDGGTLEIGVPDGELIYDRYLNSEDPKYKGNWAQLVHSLFGNIEILRSWHGKDAELYGHHMLFSKDYLRAKMEALGLKDIKDIPPDHPDCFSLSGIK